MEADQRHQRKLGEEADHRYPARAWAAQRLPTAVSFFPDALRRDRRAAQGANPQNLSSLGGKVLRVRSDGWIPTTNPFYRRGGNARYVWNYGHRNIQGLIKRPGKGELWSVENGTSRDDEINLVWKGDNYGWDPRPGYDESRPMTDKVR